MEKLKMRNIYYRDIVAIAGEDTPFVMSILFSSIHGCQRSREENKLGVVPIFVSKGLTHVWGVEKNLPNGFRIFAESAEDLDFEVSPRIDDSVKIKRVKTVSVDENTETLHVKRLRDIDAAYLRRLSKRNPGTNYSDVKKKLSVKKDKFILLDKKEKTPIFFGFEVAKDDVKFDVKNSYGFGVVPFVDFFG
jgi:hypothetical protein